MKALVRFLVLVILCVLLARRAGDSLVVERIQQADAIVVLAGDSNDARFSRGLELLRQGYSPTMFVDESDDSKFFGQSVADLARRFIEQDPAISGKVKVCPIREDSTNSETKYVEKCVGSAPSLLLVTSDFHTRRARSIFQKQFKGRVVYVAAAHNPAVFGTRWWEHREWAKTTLVEWQKLLWWELVERWR